MTPQKPEPPKKKEKKVIPDPKRPNDNQSNQGNLQQQNPGRNQGGNTPPSPWLNGTPSTDKTASFVEYLRWMRQPQDKKYDPTTQLQLMQIAEESANYQKRLELLNARTKRLAGEGNHFEVTCPWRIRVGGTKGQDGMLLPAFDALGMPYIPSSTLRGIARSYAIRQFMETEGMDWKESDRHVEKWFGHLDGKDDNRSGKVIFFDAYPTPSKNGGLAIDMANSIWRWEGDKLGKYNPNPNAFFSLRAVSFIIGIRPVKPEYADQAEQVRKWLIAGLAQGAGSQVNSGYGVLQCDRAPQPKAFFQVSFGIRGQLIHGRQKFTQWNWNQDRSEWQHRGASDAEVRPIAMKSMLRYWFRVFARGVLPAKIVREWEAKIFGGIDPEKCYGYLCVRVLDGKITKKEARSNYEGKNDKYGEGEGVLSIFHSSESSVSQLSLIENLSKSLVWMSFHLGGVGQGARRPLYSRRSRERAPWWRGSALVAYLDDDSTSEDENFWDLPDSTKEFKRLFQKHLQDFYSALSQLCKQEVNPQNLQLIESVSNNQWAEVADSKCRILVCTGEENQDKPYALAVLHSPQFKINGNYDGNLCGCVHGGTVKPSPVWISNPDKKYQIVTVFGATADPRKKFVDELIKQKAIQIFPLK